MPPEPNAAKAEVYLERALTVARRQQAKSWEAARSNERGVALARPSEATASSLSARSGLWLLRRRFETRNLKEAKALLDALSPPPDATLTSKDAT
jgi:hypothetical protein